MTPPFKFQPLDIVSATTKTIREMHYSYRQKGQSVVCLYKYEILFDFLKRRRSHGNVYECVCVYIAQV